MQRYYYGPSSLGSILLTVTLYIFIAFMFIKILSKYLRFEAGFLKKFGVIGKVNELKLIPEWKLVGLNSWLGNIVLNSCMSDYFSTVGLVLIMNCHTIIDNESVHDSFMDLVQLKDFVYWIPISVIEKIELESISLWGPFIHQVLKQNIFN